MKKYILYIFLLLVCSTNSIGAEIIRYQTENRSSLLDNKMASTIIKGATSKDLNFNTSTPICNDLYKYVYDENENIKYKSKVDAQKYLIDFNYKEGTFTCSYVNEKEFGNASKSIILSIPNYTLLLGYIDGTKSGKSLVDVPTEINDVYNLFNGEYKPSNLSVLPEFEHYETTWEAIKKLGNKILTIGNSTDDSASLVTTAYDVMSRAKSLGLTFLGQNTDKENFTVSQFVTGLITLNSSVVTGVDSMGDISISSGIENKMAILDSVEYQKGIWDKFKDKVSEVYKSATGDGITDVNYTNVYSFEQYFDKKIFALYYRFMSLGWQSIFDYAGVLILAMVFLYSGGVIGYKYVMFRINNNNENKEWDFPFSSRFVAISVMLVVFFLHFPTGNSQTVSLNNNDSDKMLEVNTTINNQNIQMDSYSTVFKEVIGFLASMGAQIADLTASNIGVIYMTYLTEVTHTKGYADTITLLNQNRRDIVEQAVLQSFFKDNCIASHKSIYKNHNGFQMADSHIDLLWGVNTGSNKIFNDSGTISPLMCKNLETSLMIGREYLKRTKAVSEKTISNLSKNSNVNFTTNNSSYTTMSHLYIDTQLLGFKSIGWFMASTLPVSHVFMLNSNIINNAYDGLSRTTNGEAVTTMLVNKANDIYEKDGENVSKQTLDTEILNSTASNWIKNSFSTMMSYQVYNMFPFFGEIRQFFEKAVEGTGESLFEIAGIFLPQSKLSSFAKSSLDKFVKETNEQKSKNSKESNIFNQKNIDVLSSGFKSFLSYTVSFTLAVIVYKLMIQGIFAAVVTLLAILKIGLYFWDCFMYFFVSPFMVLWQMTVKEKTNRVNAYFVDGFVLFMARPTLMVISFFMFIVSYEILIALYSLLFDVIQSMLNLSNSLYEDSSIATSVVAQSVIRGFADIFVYFIGMILAYVIILKGDDMVLAKFKYKDDSDSGLTNLLGERIQTLGGARI
ncbi:hypothetical protein [Arcobacter sp. L]|uniref:hypothetical protein n=1 Tax=Arcobacter sp. L TaxID=944547 RepID=UPI0002296583|nr:hypothetical protein [Arcobacter sp. L]BAK73243.1 conserved hypothetical protein [Arcobacter sp. L]